MTRGVRSNVGDTRVAPNGYHYTRTGEGWQLTHRVMAERDLGRRLLSNERIRFLDRDRANLNPSNIEVYTTKEKTVAAKKAVLESKIEDLQAELEALDD